MITEEEILKKTRDFVHNFINRTMTPETVDMSQDLVWIGGLRKQFFKDLESFFEDYAIKSTEGVVLRDNFQLQSHNGNLWIVYGMYTVSSFSTDKHITLETTVRGTFIWQQEGDQVQLIHIHSSIPFDTTYLPSSSKAAYKVDGLLGFIQETATLKLNDARINIRDNMGAYRFLIPSEIVYLEADGKHTTIHTRNDHFTVVGNLGKQGKDLPEHFQRIQRSYIVNTFYIKSLRCYEVELKTGLVLPVSKDQYTRIKNYFLKQKDQQVEISQLEE